MRTPTTLITTALLVVVLLLGAMSTMALSTALPAVRAAPDAARLGQTTAYFDPVADAYAYVSQAAPTTNFGTSTRLDVQNLDAEIPDDRRSYVGFDLSTIPSNAIITGAAFKAYLFEAYGLSSVSIQLRQVTSSWAENTITWNSKPSSSPYTAINCPARPGSAGALPPVASRGRARGRGGPTPGLVGQNGTQVSSPLQSGGLAGLFDWPRSGRRRQISFEQALKIVETATTRPHRLGLPFNTWSLSHLQRYLVAQGIVPAISREEIRQILHRHGLTWQKARTWQESRDKHFAVRWDDYVLGALNPHTGQVWARCFRSYNRWTVIWFLGSLLRQMPQEVTIPIIWDQASAHKAGEVTQWLKQHYGEQVHLHRTPGKAAWLNLIEALTCTFLPPQTWSRRAKAPTEPSWVGTAAQSGSWPGLMINRSRSRTVQNGT